MFFKSGKYGLHKIGCCDQVDFGCQLFPSFHSYTALITHWYISPAFISEEYIFISEVFTAIFVHIFVENNGIALKCMCRLQAYIVVIFN